MLRVFMLGGAGCLLVSSTVYVRLFLRRDSYQSPLDYARALSGSRALDRHLSDCVIRDVTWLKFFSNILLPFLAAIALVLAVMPGGETPVIARLIWVFAACVTVLALLTVKLFSRVSFILLLISHASLAVALFFFVPFLGMTIPVALSVILALALWMNALYMVRRRGLFFNAEARPKPPETESEPESGAATFAPEMLTPADRLEWMLSESRQHKSNVEQDVS